MPKSEKPSAKEVVVKEPSKIGEFEIQAYLYSKLREFGINIRGEVKVHYSSTGTKFDKQATCRFDLAEFREGKLVGIIEVKSKKIKHKTADGWNGTRQGKRYKNYGVPVLIVYGLEDAERIVSSAQETGRVPFQP